MRLIELAEKLEAELVGDGEKEIENLSPLASADSRSLTFLSNPKYLKVAKESSAGAILTQKSYAIEGKNLLIHKNPYAAWARALSIFYPPKKFPSFVHQTAVIEKTAEIEKDCFIGPFVVVGKNSKIGKNSVIEAGCVIGDNCQIGADCHLYPRVVLYDDVELKNRVILHSGVVVGSDGFGYAEESGAILKVPQIGKVIIEDDVEIGANTTIDRGAIDKTLIGQGSKIDNLCQIAHNVVLEKNCVIIAQSGISGSTRLGEGVIMSGQSGAVGHIKIGSFSVIGAKSAVTRDVPEKSHYTGIPAQDHKKWLKEVALLRKLEEIYEKITKENKND
ncbi:MAG: UDP-3-O-(3-hydroxymyristoyl)glucosamine N-acyltransferase [Acidobacteria bacterium]|nr:UDP-3-O-(3-hydroxymyristoyl)glucosamine N-acyltransferase [Acidobacteriota bacterium]